MNSYTAVGLIEGFIEAESEEQVLEAWSFIGQSGLWRQLQGFYGRTLHSLIEGGWLDEEFNII
jgi:hypothetical protein